MKHLFLIRGLPGSGKSSLAETLSERGKYPVCSIDSYFTHPQTGVYKFEYLNNHLAYKHCEDETKKAMEQGVEKIFVDNTFVQDWEMEPYLKLAQKFHYRVHVITTENRHGGKNIHDIPEEQVEKMREKFKMKL